MSAETAKLERDNTMVTTAKEGEAFLETAGKVDEDAKTRAQQKEIEEITSTEGDDSELKRTRTMTETAKEGRELLDGEELGKTRSQTECEKNSKDATSTENKEDKGLNGVTTTKEPNGVTTTKEPNGVTTTKEPNGVHEESNEDEDKSPLKRTRTMEETVKEGEEFLKKQKLESDDSKPEVVS